jgi:ABC-type branched-subunit amino acid transport system permease subunit
MILKNVDLTEKFLAISLPLLIIVGLLVPDWIQFFMQVSMASGLVALGVMIQARAGLVSFGQGLYFCIGGYAAGMAGHFWGISDAFLLLLFGFLSALLLAALIGILLSRYREIFFAMLSLALSMILYGILVKAEVLGSTDGFNLPKTTFLGWAPEGAVWSKAVYVFTCVPTIIIAMLLHRYLRSPMGFVGEAIRENELRVEYLGTSAKRAVHINYVIAAAVSGIGGVLAAMAVGHVDPEMTYWTTSGQFVFVVLLSGTGNIVAPLIGTFLLEILRIYAVEISPNTWQMILGSVMLIIIIFLPKGLWSLITLIKKKRGNKHE